MNCEYCDNQHTGVYGSGRFCSSKCAKSYSTRDKREEINKKISLKLKGRPSWSRGSFKPGYDPRKYILTEEDRVKASVKSIEVRSQKRLSCTFPDASKAERKRRVLEEQNGVCLRCGINEWNGDPLILELDHIDGNKRHNKRENLRVLCPNCHSQTPTFRNKKRPTDGNGIPDSLKTNRFSVQV